MRAVFVFTLVAAVCVALAWWVASLPGSVAIAIGTTTIQASAPVALVLAIVLFAILYGLIRLIAWIFATPRNLRRWNKDKTRRRGDHAMTRTLVALAANDVDAARREAGKTRALLGETPLTLLLAAQAERQAGHDDAALTLFQRLAARPEARLLGLRGQLRIAVQNQDWETAAALARQADETHPGSRWLRDERQRMALHTGQYKEALRLMGKAPRNRPEDRAVRAALSVGAARTESDPAVAMRLARDAYEMDPAFALAATEYAKALRGAGKDRGALNVLRQCWTRAPHPAVAAAYLAPTEEKEARHRAAQQLAASNPHHPDSALLLSRTALEAGLTAEARRHAETARNAGMTDRRVWIALADIAEADGDRAAAQDALRHLASAPPEPTWICRACGKQHQDWHPVCEACGAPGALHWAAPAAVPAGLLTPHATPPQRRLPPPVIEGVA